MYFVFTCKHTKPVFTIPSVNLQYTAEIYVGNLISRSFATTLLVVACDCLSSGEDAVKEGVSVGVWGCEFGILAAVGPL
jgi:hypothetical protein